MILDRNQLRLAHLIHWGRQVLRVIEICNQMPGPDPWDDETGEVEHI
jgi:hypothetical protein